MKTLLARLESAGLYNGSEILLDRPAPGQTRFVLPEDFERMFGGALAEEDQHASLLTADDNGDETSKGYAQFFKAWRDAGVL